MAYLNPAALDSGLDYLDTHGTRLDLCSAEPGTYAQATGTYSLGFKTGLNTGAPATDGSNGRQVQVPAVSDGTVTAAGTATHWALTDGSAMLLAAGPLDDDLSLATGSPWQSSAFVIRYPGVS